MAKKKKDDEDDIEHRADDDEEAAHETGGGEEEDQEAEVELDATEEEEPAAEEEQEAEELEAEEEEAVAEEGEEEEEKEEEEAELPPRPRTPIFTVVLLALNLLAAPIFVLAMYMDYAARFQWSYPTFVNRVIVWGLPLEADEKGPGLSLAGRPRLRLEPEALKSAYTSPGRSGKASGDFELVDTIDEPIASVIKPSQIDDSVKRDLFTKNGLDEPVATLEDEVRRIKVKLPGWINEAAKKVTESADTPAKKEAALVRILLPLAWSTDQVEKLRARIDAAKAQGPAELDNLLVEAAKRRMLLDALGPMNIYRPGDVEKYSVEKACEEDLSVLEGLLGMRIGEAINPTHQANVHLGESLLKQQQRDDAEKRHNIAFLLTTLSRVKVPESKEMLVPKGYERAQVVCGSFEYAIAATNYARTLPVLEKRILELIERDREGYVVEKGQSRAGGFVASHKDYINLMKKAQTEIDYSKKRLKELAVERDRFQKQYEARAKLLTEVKMQLVSERKKTAEELKLLREKEKELFDALRDLSDAADRNFRLERRIVEAEGLLLPKKGKTP